MHHSEVRQAITEYAQKKLGNGVNLSKLTVTYDLRPYSERRRYSWEPPFSTATIEFIQ